ncbi:MAG: Bax inhibitor-1/YccA family protein [Alphaproteobacteria bacterium]|nr:Bax inhibitor-1/YccA family protein [Alphaproteobacteria bacterium]
MQHDRNTFAAPRDTTIDVGLRTHMQRVYNMMAIGLVLTGLLAFAVGTSEELFKLYYTNPMIRWPVILAPLGIVFFGLTPSKVQRMSIGMVAGLYLTLTALFGISLSSIFMMYSTESIARVFFITAGMFSATSIYGYTTKKDLTSMGSFMFMGLIGIIIASVVNIFMQSTMMHFIISCAGVVIFTGLTAWDTQRIKETYNASYGHDSLTKMAIMGALSLYLDFINLFMMLLRLFGGRD